MHVAASQGRAELLKVMVSTIKHTEVVQKLILVSMFIAIKTGHVCAAIEIAEV